ncbi:myb-like protein B [Cylas formicarius]|uniref:myb-like protein B n=1 Tax=Cylas formicarius TaxID=197179 RepID=UPI002958369C|nr:myb-like protein B [Cylas formicarius]
MLWILRRTRVGLTSAASILNNINNNENRPGRKGYDKLSAHDDVTKNSSKTNENEDNNNGACKDNCKATNGNTSAALTDSDNESTFTDVEYDDNDGFSDDSDYEEALTCNVCDRTFSCPKQLSAHKQKKRHFGCSACDSLFPSLMALEHHKEEFEHWSEEDDICTDSDEDDDTVISEECERLL